MAVLKVSCDDHIYRISVPWESDSASLWRLIESAVPGLGQRTLVFVDPVGKEQPLSSSTYSLFKSTAREAVSGRPILKLEAVPVTADSSRGSPPLSDKGPNDGIVLRLRAYAGRGRRQPRGVQQTRTWEEDPRDLDELLAQFDTQDSNAATVKKPGKVKKRKNTTERSSLHSGEVLVEDLLNMRSLDRHSRHQPIETHKTHGRDTHGKTHLSFFVGMFILNIIAWSKRTLICFFLCALPSVRSRGTQFDSSRLLPDSIYTRRRQAIIQN